MANPTEIQLYMDRARTALQQAADNLSLGHYDVVNSRAYYAMFYAATAGLMSKNLTRSKHSGVHSAFGQFFVKTGLIEPQYGQMLVNAFNIRLDSDYEVQPNTNRAVAEDTLQDGQAFVDRIDGYLRQEGHL